MTAAWHPIGSSADLAPGDVRTLELFGTRLVLFRTERGEPCLIDAYCPHSGMHLGFGGTVRGECIECPLHGWLWSVNGSLVSVPGGARPRITETIRRWQLREVDGQLLAWHED